MPEHISRTCPIISILSGRSYHLYMPDHIFRTWPIKFLLCTPSYLSYMPEHIHPIRPYIPDHIFYTCPNISLTSGRSYLSYIPDHLLYMPDHLLYMPDHIYPIRPIISLVHARSYLLHMPDHISPIYPTVSLFPPDHITLICPTISLAFANDSYILITAFYFIHNTFITSTLIPAWLLHLITVSGLFQQDPSFFQTEEEGCEYPAGLNLRVLIANTGRYQVPAQEQEYHSENVGEFAPDQLSLLCLNSIGK